MTEQQNFIDNTNDFEARKRNYFISLGLKVREAFKLHKKFELWDRNEEGTKDWGNVSEHCLVEAARVGVLGKLLGLSEKTQNDLVLAAAIHDFYKKHQILRTPKGVSLTLQDEIESDDDAHREMVNAGVAPEVVLYASSVASVPSTMYKMQSILKQEEVSEEDLASLAMQYVDTYTIGSDWSGQAEASENGKKINDVNRRLEKARQNPKYKQIDEDGKKYFDGITSHDTQESVGESIERYLVSRIKNKTGQEIDPKDLPTFIDEEIRKDIDGE